VTRITWQRLRRAEQHDREWLRDSIQE